MMEYAPKKSPGCPLYTGLYEAIKDDILSGRMPFGAKLLSKRQLAHQIGCSITTVENAYTQLKLEGLIHSEKAKGFFVSAEQANARVLPPADEVTDWEKNYFQEIEDSADEEFLIDFKANQSSLSLFPFSTWTRLMRRVMSGLDLKLLSTVPFNGVYPLRKTIANYLYRSRGMSVNPAQVIIGAGTEFLYGRLLSLLGTDSIFAIEDPGYKRLAEVSSQQGTLWDYVPIDGEGINMDRLRKSHANIVHVSPANHFPTGTIMSYNRRQELLSWANESPERYIIEDDYDSELRYVGHPISPLYATDVNRKVIYLNTFSKSLVPSLRISYMVLPAQLLERYQTTMSFYSCTVSSFEQLTLAAFIEEGHFERHINRLKKHYRDKRDYVVGAFKSSRLSAIASIQEASAGTHFLLRLRTQKDDAEIKSLAAKMGVKLSMLSDYAHSASIKTQRVIVINYAGVDEEKCALAIALLEDIFSEDISAVLNMTGI